MSAFGLTRRGVEGVEMGFVHYHVADNRNPRSLASRMRRARFAQFRAMLAVLPGTARVLDVGGALGFWQAMHATREGLRVTLLNRSLPSTPLPAGFDAVVGDARAMVGFADKQFDLVFSNSVIEHVGSYADQRRMANEVRRVGVRYFVQTPNRYFPIEPHFLWPFFQFYPQALQVALTRRFALGWYARMPDLAQARAHVASHRLLTARDMRELFPEAEIRREWIAGLTKSLLAIGPR